MSEMDFKQQAEQFCLEVDEFAKGRLHNSEDLTRLTEVIFKTEKNKLLEDISFTSKYAQGLLKIVQNRSNNIEDDYFVKIRGEYTEAVKQVQSQLKEILEDSSSFIKNIFTEKYLSLTHESLNNLNQLIDDLSWVKMYLNEKKR
jgi:hypothetical protein